MTRNLRLASSAVLSAFALLGLATLQEACTTAPPDARGGPSDAASADRAQDTGRPRDIVVDSIRDVDGGPPVLTELAVTLAATSDASTAITLVPDFSPDVHDYYVRCGSGDNVLAVTMTASAGSETRLTAPAKSASAPTQTVSPLIVSENQAIVAVAAKGEATDEYWVRCLPPDFPDIEMKTHPEAGAPSPGYYLVGDILALGPRGGYAMVLDTAGVPVWYHLESSGGVCNVDEVAAGNISFAPVRGGPFRFFELDTDTETDRAPLGTPLDLHEIRLLSNGDYLVLSSPLETGVDLTGLHLSPGDAGALGPGSTIVGCNIAEFDPTGAVVWTWVGTDHFDPAKDCTEPTLAPPASDGGRVIDAFHCNSIDVDPMNGNLLVSARQMDSVFYVERSTGAVLWKMGGADAATDPARYVAVASPFIAQHDARLLAGWSSCGGQISLFDDQTYGEGPARGVVYDVALGGADGGCDGGAAGATVAWQYEGAEKSGASGSFRVSADGTRLIGWGVQDNVVFTEVDVGGAELLELQSNNSAFAYPMQSYRALKVPRTALDLEAMRKSAGSP